MEDLGRVKELAGINEDSSQQIQDLTTKLINGGFGFSSITNRIETTSTMLKARGVSSYVVAQAVSNYLNFLDGHLDDII